MTDSDIEDEGIEEIVSTGRVVEPLALGLDERAELHEQLREYDRVRARGAAMASADPNSTG